MRGWPLKTWIGVCAAVLSAIVLVITIPVLRQPELSYQSPLKYRLNLYPAAAAALVLALFLLSPSVRLFGHQWSLRFRFGYYAAVLSTIALVVALMELRPLVYRHQLAELDEQLKDNAEELFRDLENFKGAPNDFRKPVTERFIPVSLRGRYIQITGPEDQTLYRSANLRGADLKGGAIGMRTVSRSRPSFCRTLTATP